MPLVFANFEDDGPAGIAFRHLLGALHPLVVHFPIALLLTAALIETFTLWIRESPGLRFAVVVNLVLGTLGAVIAAPLGWIDATQMHFEPDLRPVLEWHRWLGTSVALLSLITLALRWNWSRKRTRSSLWIYRGLLWMLAIILGIAGHLGGLLVYGLDYFSS
jgi:uncharacterized membrane protein